MPQTLVTHKLTPEAQRVLRLIAAQTGEKQYAVLERVLHLEWQRLQAQHRPKES